MKKKKGLNQITKPYAPFEKGWISVGEDSRAFLSYVTYARPQTTGLRTRAGFRKRDRAAAKDVDKNNKINSKHQNGPWL